MRPVPVRRRLQAGFCVGLLCAISAVAISHSWPDRYVSDATLRFDSRYVPGRTPGQLHMQIDLRLSELQRSLFSHSALAAILQASDVDLYPLQTPVMPLEDVQDLMRKKIRLWSEDSTTTIQLSFESEDPRKARLVAGMLVARMLRDSFELDHGPVGPESIAATEETAGEPTMLGPLTGPDSSATPKADRSPTPAAETPALRLDTVQPPNLPDRPEGPNRWAIGAIGLVAGILLGQALLAIRRASVRAVLWLTAAALAGFAAAGGITWLLPEEMFADLVSRVPFAGLGAAAGVLAWGVSKGLRSAWRRPHYGWAAVAGALFGAIVAGFAAYAIPVRSESSAVVRFSPAQPEVPAETVRARLVETEQEVLGSLSLASVVLKPPLDLYPLERAWRPLEEVLADMRSHDLHIRPENSLGALNTIRISFAYPDPQKAQATVREIVSRLASVNRSAAGSVVTEEEYRNRRQPLRQRRVSGRRSPSCSRFFDGGRRGAPWRSCGWPPTVRRPARC